MAEAPPPAKRNEVWVRIELTIRVLQTHALPLGDQTIYEIENWKLEIWQIFFL
jgi:hypothetical protein